MHRQLLLLLCVLLSATTHAAEDSENKYILGVNADLAAGADALLADDFEKGIRLTLRGLNFAGSTRNLAHAYSNLCGGYAKTGQFEAAIEYCDKSLALRPQNWRAYHNRALSLIGQGKLRDAIDDALAGLKIAPKAPSLLEVLELAQRLDREPHVIMDQFPPAADS